MYDAQCMVQVGFRHGMGCDTRLMRQSKLLALLAVRAYGGMVVMDGRAWNLGAGPRLVKRAFHLCRRDML